MRKAFIDRDDLGQGGQREHHGIARMGDQADRAVHPRNRIRVKAQLFQHRAARRACLRAALRADETGRRAQRPGDQISLPLMIVKQQQHRCPWIDRDILWRAAQRQRTALRSLRSVRFDRQPHRAAQLLCRIHFRPGAQQQQAQRRCIAAVEQRAIGAAGFARIPHGHGAAIQRPGQRRRFAPVQRLHRLGQQRAVRRGVHQHIQPAAAGQAKIDIGRSGAIAQHLARVVCYCQPRRIRRQRGFQTAIGQIAGKAAIAANRQLRAGAP